MRAYSKKYNYIIYWSAKSGCTYFRQLFLELHKNELVGNSSNLWHALESDFPIPPTITNIDSIPKIVLCRNPYKRVVSMFCNKYCGGPGHATLSSKFTLQKITFRQFVLKLQELKNQQKINSTDIHIAEQSNGINFTNCHIVRLETFDESICEIYKKIGLESLIPKIEMFISKNTFINKTKRVAEETNVSDKEYNINNTIFPGYKNFYDKQLLDLVYEIYKNDFINFKYKKDCF